MKTTSIFKFIVTIVMVIFSTTINAQSAQINSTTDFSDYNDSVFGSGMTIVSNGFHFPGYANKLGNLGKSYQSQFLDSVKVSFKIHAISDETGGRGFYLEVKAGSVTPKSNDTVNNNLLDLTYIYEHTFIGNINFDSLNIAIRAGSSSYNLNYGGTITVDSLVITGYSQSGSIWTESGTVGIEENVDNVTNFNTYPNPNSGQFKVTFETKSLSTPVMVYDIQGRLVYEDKEDREIGMNTINIDMFNVSSGVYFVKVKNEVFKMQVIK